MAADWALENIEPAGTLPMPDWTQDAQDEAVTPTAAKPRQPRSGTPRPKGTRKSATAMAMFRRTSPQQPQAMMKWV